jgi:hypothetical protein
MPFKGFCSDSFICFEINSSADLVQSAPIDVPAGTVISIGFETTNTSSEFVFSQGYVIEANGKKIVKYQSDYSIAYNGNPSYYSFITTPYNNRPFPDAAENTFNNLIYGPCTIKFFCKNSALRGMVYIKTDNTYTYYYQSKILNPNETSFTINVPQNNIAGVNVWNFGLQSVQKGMVSGSGNTFSNKSLTSIVNPYGTGGPPYNNEPTLNAYFSEVTTQTTNSSVVSWARIGEIQSSRTVSAPHIGPCTITFKYTNSSDLYSFSIIKYYTSPANYTYNSTSGSNNNSNAPVVYKNVNLILERSTDLQNWSAIDTILVTETAGKAFYRIKITSN